ncbi:MAG: hypothetical protein RLZZ444_1909 [Pseudomonadota bacterium]|jgi:acyl dehydratase
MDLSTIAENPPGAKTIAELQALEGQVVGISPWIGVDQARINAFADITEDHQFIHIDPVRAAQSPFGGTIAHGFLTLSLLSRMAETALPAIAEASATVNYGFDRIRFLSPVPAGSEIRGKFQLDRVTPKAGGQTLFQYSVDVEIKGASRPAVAANWLILALSDSKENEE